jgi:hypothetical protein
VCLLIGHGNVVCRQKKPCFVFVERQLIGTDLRNLACQPRFVEREDGIASSSDDHAPISVRPLQGISERPSAAVTLEEMQVVDDQRHNGETKRLADLMPELPLIGDLRWVEAHYRTGLWRPLAGAGWFCHSQPEPTRA